MKLRYALSVTPVLAVALLASACGSSGQQAASPPDATTTVAANPDGPALGPVGDAETEAVFTLGGRKEFSMVGSVASVPSGEVSFTITNKGKLTHEFVLLKTDRKAADLEPNADNPQEVIEPGFVVEAEDLAPGGTVKMKVPLPAGHYVFVCNQLGHATHGHMYTDFNVT